MFQLDSEFYRLPLRFDALRLAEEVTQFGEEEWRAHPQGHAGNSALPLISVGGGLNDEVKGPMRPTPFLARCPYVQQVLASLGTVLGRARLMRIAGQHDATPHVDTNYYWMHHVRIHIPALTYPEVRFLCLDQSVHMAAGECWIFDSWKEHNVLNPVAAPRIHLVADTVGSARFWDLVERSGEESVPVPFDPTAGEPGLTFEEENYPVVMSPFEQQALGTRMLASLPVQIRAGRRARSLQQALSRLHQQWHALWTEGRDAERLWPAYRQVLAGFDTELERLASGLALSNGVSLTEALRQAIVRSALNPEVLGKRSGSASLLPPPSVPPTPRIDPGTSSSPGESRSETPLVLSVPLDRPVFIVSAPRSGSSMLFELLAQAPDVWTLGGESHAVIESLPKFDPAQRGYDSNRLTAADADPEAVEELQRAFFYRLRNRAGRPVITENGAIRMLEKTPKNALRVSFLAEAFPGARFIFLYREPRGNIASILDAWRSEQFITYPGLPDWNRPEKWSMLLVEGWRDLAAQPLPEIAARQWQDANRQILDDLSTLNPHTWCAVSYAELCANPQGVAERLSAFAGWRWDIQLQGPPPLSQHTLTPPAPDKWRRHEAVLEPILPRLQPVVDRAAAALSQHPPHPANPAVAPHIAVPALDFASQHTDTFSAVLESLGVSLAVSTYQAGRLVLVRSRHDELNTHFCDFPSPMGLAFRPGVLALGTQHEILNFRAFHQVAAQLPPAGTHDAVFLPATRYTTGDIRVHDLAWAGHELWAVNTLFSCLCTFDGEHNFVPRWRPPFISGLAGEDRCHLNGLAMVEGEPAFVTALGETDTAGGWRANKRNGGILLHVPTDEILVRGLSMPHSPRWYDDRLWVLESGTGRVCIVEPETGAVEVFAELPGFTRGLDFCGPYAFVGLSQVRETAVFSDLPICAPGRERQSGVWVLDLRTAETVAFLRFAGSVQEIFAVQTLPARYPELLTANHDLIGEAFFLPPQDQPAPPEKDPARVG